MKRDEAVRFLTEGLQSLLNQESFKRFLVFRTKFHTYSWHNALLILMQKPDATRVAGYKTWQELGRQVRRGEQGIAILAPLIKRISVEADGSDQSDRFSTSDQRGPQQSKIAGVERRATSDRILVGFRVVYVFDISQTEGEPVPEGPQPKLLSGEDSGLLGSLRQFAHRRGWQVLDEPSPAAPDANGECSIEEKVIRIRPDLDPLQKTKTLAHELGHVLLHSESGSVPRSVREVEAESVAFVVMACLGYAEQAGDYSFPYLAHWMANGRQADAKILTERIGKILDAADAILKALLPQAS